ncbi:MAG TPA: transketolase C-terminal domain-containing protein, partial [Thermoplasmata archaeon]|nr:transketolase C-terminal domain-containing protein [Thermoplasmata archaeon]
THQPVEHLASLRAIPGMTVLRPADATETVAAWKAAIERRGPVALVFTRQKLPVLGAPGPTIAAGVARGAYTIADADCGTPALILIGTGSEVSLCLSARARLVASGIDTRVVSMPSWELFDEQPEGYRSAVLPRRTPKIAVEAGSPLGWERYVGSSGRVVGLDRFGASGPGPAVQSALGFTVDRVVELGRSLVPHAPSPSEP